MPILNFREIPAANVATGEQDTFELFARDFLQYLGFSVEEGPDRGVDRGRDVIVRETRSGICGETSVRWMVSCKHKAHSGSSVQLADDTDVRDRVDSHGCQGFIGFYSTIPSSGLASKVNALVGIEKQWFDHERIEHELLRSKEGRVLAQRYFPVSMARWIREHHGPADLFGDSVGLHCEHCDRDLLAPPSGIVVILDRDVTDAEGDIHQEVVDLYWCCKGSCDRALVRVRRHRGLVDKWKDIPDIIVPVVFAKWIMTTINQLHAGHRYTEDALVKYRRFLLELFQHVSRHPTDAEEARLQALRRIPGWIGGMGDP